MLEVEAHSQVEAEEQLSKITAWKYSREGVNWRRCPSDRERSSHSSKLSSTNSALNCADSSSAHALSQERRAARTARQNLTDTFLACADKALAGGVQHHWG